MSILEIAGYASLFGVRDLAGDVVERGAFSQSLEDLPAPDVRMLYQHDGNKPIGEWHELYEDNVGLWARGRIYDYDNNSALAQSEVRNRKTDGLSIGFRTIDAKPIEGGRILKQIDLREISLVTFPMLPRARLKLIRPFDETNQSIQYVNA